MARYCPYSVRVGDHNLAQAGDRRHLSTNNGDPRSNSVGMASGLDLGQPLGQGRHLEGGGSASPSSSEARGYSIIEAESLDAAAKMVEDHPHFMTPGGSSIGVFELLEMPGM